MKAAVITKPGKIEIQEIAKPVPAAGEVLIQVHSSGICGTDVHIFQGEYTGSYPIIPGHEFSGTIVEIGSDVTDFNVGNRVAVEPNISCGICYDCMEDRQHYCRTRKALGVDIPGGMAEFVVAPVSAVFNVKELISERAAFVEPLSCVLHGIENLNPRLGDNALLIGSGPIGLLLLQALKIRGCSWIDVVDLDANRLEKAKEMGASRCHTSFKTVEEEGFKLVIDATGSSVVQEASLRYCRSAGKILWFGVPVPGKKVEIEPFEIFQRELTIMSAFTSRHNTWQAISLLQSGALKVDSLISHRLRLDELEKGIQIMKTHSEPSMKILIDPRL